MINFYLDIESDAKDMQSLTAVQKALVRTANDLQDKIKRGNDTKPCSGNILDSNGNEVGEWVFEPSK